jgi:hypothetical protein
MSTLTLALLSRVTPFSPPEAGGDSDPLSASRWKHRLFVLDVPDAEPGRRAGIWPMRGSRDVASRPDAKHDWCSKPLSTDVPT